MNATGSRFFAGRAVTVTGGASFIGSHLCRALLEAGAAVRVVDDFSSGSQHNLHDIAGDLDILRLDLRSRPAADAACAGAEIVFHLAAAHGGRGYIDNYQTICAENVVIDQNVLRGALNAGVDKVVLASSACVYPGYLQRADTGHRPLREDQVGPPYDPDGMYGMAKLMGELTLRNLHREHGLGAAICRYFTAYGPQCGESHAIVAMIARAFVGTDPFEVWGTGDQVRCWIYIDDLVRMTLLAAQRIDDGGAVNIASDESHTVRGAAELVLRVTGRQARIVSRPDMPVGPLTRTADTALSRALLGYVPRIGLAEGVRRTAQWYFSTKDEAVVAANLDRLLVEREPLDRRAG
ncbi:NAD-dependent epimerase/dehydratase family protein [Solwaraspora sp. WMMB335]|uniref:NAD-dependent epimerase/dehydratase family protein n=1 Tax=Solwaraspora sp. WMMB335 TaxID=3404118 RepID=UPI003B93292D